MGLTPPSSARRHVPGLPLLVVLRIPGSFSARQGTLVTLILVGIATTLVIGVVLATRPGTGLLAGRRIDPLLIDNIPEPGEPESLNTYTWAGVDLRAGSEFGGGRSTLEAPLRLGSTPNARLSQVVDRLDGDRVLWRADRIWMRRNPVPPLDPERANEILATLVMCHEPDAEVAIAWMLDREASRDHGVAEWFGQLVAATLPREPSVDARAQMRCAELGSHPLGPGERPRL